MKLLLATIAAILATLTFMHPAIAQAITITGACSGSGTGTVTIACANGAVPVTDPSLPGGGVQCSGGDDTTTFADAIGSGQSLIIPSGCHIRETSCPTMTTANQSITAVDYTGIIEQTTYGACGITANANNEYIGPIQILNTQPRSRITGFSNGFPAGTFAAGIIIGPNANDVRVDHPWVNDFVVGIYAQGGTTIAHSATSSCTSNCTSLTLNGLDQQPDNYYDGWAIEVLNSSGTPILSFVNVTGYTNATNAVTFTSTQQISLASAASYVLINQVAKSTGNDIEGPRFSSPDFGIVVSDEDQLRINNPYCDQVIGTQYLNASPQHCIYFTDGGFSGQLRSTGLSGNNWNCGQDLYSSTYPETGSCFKLRGVDGFSINKVRAGYAPILIEVEDSTLGLISNGEIDNFGDPLDTGDTNAAGIVYSTGNVDVTFDGIVGNLNPSYTNNEGSGGNAARRPAAIYNCSLEYSEPGLATTRTVTESGVKFLHIREVITNALTGSSANGEVGECNGIAPTLNTVSDGVDTLIISDPGAATIATMVRPLAATNFHAVDLHADIAPSNVAQFDVARSASGTYTFGSNPANGQTVILNGSTWTFVTSGASGDETNIGANLAATLTQLASDLGASSDPNIDIATYSASSTVLTITAGTAGTAGNGYTLAVGTYGGTISAPTLLGGTNVASSYVAWQSNLVAGTTGVSDSSGSTGSSINKPVVDGSYNCGSWSPTVNPTTPGDWSVGSVTAQGTCYRVGNLVYVQFAYVATPTFSTASGSLIISGFPYKAQNITTPGGVGMTTSSSGIAWPSSATMATVSMVQNSATANVTGLKSGANGVLLSTTGLTSGSSFTIRAAGVYATSDGL